MAKKATKKQWLDALTKARQLYGRVLNRVENGQWDQARRLLPTVGKCAFCELARKEAAGSPCKVCPLTHWKAGLCSPAYDFVKAVSDGDLDQAREMAALARTNYRKTRRWVREHYDG